MFLIPAEVCLVFYAYTTQIILRPIPCYFYLYIKKKEAKAGVKWRKTCK